MDDKVLNELPRPQAVDKIPPAGLRVEINASPEECAAVAARLGLLRLDSLQATLDLQRDTDGLAINVNGKLTAKVQQACVVTLVPVPATLAEAVTGCFMPPEAIPDEEGALTLTDADEPVIDPIVQGMIDVGELVVQHLSLALDPYPRAPGAETAVRVEAGAAAGRQKPFLHLADLVKNQEK